MLVRPQLETLPDRIVPADISPLNPLSPTIPTATSTTITTLSGAIPLAPPGEVLGSLFTPTTPQLNLSGTTTP